MAAAPGPFVEPPWASPLDVQGALEAIPPNALMAGMFFLALLDGAKRRGVMLQGARPRYLQFGFYPIAEFAKLLVIAARDFHPERPLRQGLRSIGRVGPRAFLNSTLGKVTLGATEGVPAAVAAIAKTYAINIRTSECAVLETKPRAIVLRMKNIYHFLDSHHVGVFEGALGYAGVVGQVRICSQHRFAADLLLEWE